MIDLKNIDDVRSLQSNLRASLQTPPGQEVLKWLEGVCGWFDFHDTDSNMILIKHGRRSVLAEIKTLLDCTPEQISAIAKEQQNA